MIARHLSFVQLAFWLLFGCSIALLLYRREAIFRYMCCIRYGESVVRGCI